MMGRDFLYRIRNALPSWGFPVILVLVGLVVFGLVVGLSGSGGTKSTYKPDNDKFPERQVSPDAHLQSNLNFQNDRPEILHIPLNGAASQGTPQGEQPQGATATDQPSASGGLSPGSEVPGPDAVFVFKGYGRAHGVGLCMDGVRYRAEDGQSCTDIINYYYTGVSIGQVDDNRPIKVKGRDGKVHTLPMKEYLCRLAEEPEDYPPEGLKVLYIAARTYTLNVIARGKHAGQGFDICASGNCCQAFDENKDLSKNPNNVAAVDATSGQVILFNGAPIDAAYCGSCGGHTENNEDVWGGRPLPYLRGKPDPYCSRSPHFCTVVELSVSELQRKLGVGGLKLVDLSDRTPGGRVRKARIVGSGGTKVMTGKDLAKVLGFRTPRIEYTFR